MTNLILVALMVLLAACSTAHPTMTPPGQASESNVDDLSGRWTGTWTGAGLLLAYREDGITLDLVQRGDVAVGRIVVDGAGAAESVPVDVRWAGLGGVKVRADISGDKVTLRHHEGGHLFTADLKRTPDGAHLYGTVRGSQPRVAFVLSRVTESAPAPPQAAMAEAPVAGMIAKAPEPKESTAPTREEGFADVAELAPIHFDFDKAELRKDAVDTLTAHVTWLKDHADAVVLIEGHCDERGTDEYNVALGERRAKSVSDMLAASGIPADRISTTSFGRERPVCTASTEECRMENRRAEFRIKTR